MVENFDRRLVEPRKEYWLFNFHYFEISNDGSVGCFRKYMIYRTANGMYRFAPQHDADDYSVNSWKDEIRTLSDGKVNYV